MALEDPSLTVDLTSTDGTGTYTLNDPAAPGDGLRTLADAIADGHVSDGDTVEYMVVDTTTEGASLNFERGVGTVGSTGTTLTRDTIRQSSNSDAAVSWPVGGSRTVRVALDPLGVARLAAANTFTGANTFSAAQTFNGANTFTQDQKLKKSGSAGRQIVGSDLAAGDTGGVRFIGNDSGGAETQYALIRQVIQDATDGSEDGRLEFFAITGGTNTQVFRADGTSGLADASGNKYDAFPSGTTVYFGSSAPPAGWTRQNIASDRVMKIAKSGETGGSTVAQSATVTVGATTLTESQIPAHTHDITVKSGGAVGGFSEVQGTADNNVLGTEATESTGGGGSHTHSASISSGFYPQAKIIIEATKD